jgi:predicted transcriptional regulator
MTVRDVVSQLGLRVKAGEEGLDREITGGYVSDLLSDVMAHAREGNVWVTLQVHKNVVAVAALTKVAAVILVGGREPADDAAGSADAEKIPLLSTDLSAFEIVALLHDVGIGPERRSET